MMFRGVHIFEAYQENIFIREQRIKKVFSYSAGVTRSMIWLLTVVYMDRAVNWVASTVRSVDPSFGQSSDPTGQHEGIVRLSLSTQVIFTVDGDFCSVFKVLRIAD